jgi:hypothetical protein
MYLPVRAVQDTSSDPIKPLHRRQGPGDSLDLLRTSLKYIQEVGIAVERHNSF